MTDNSGLGSPIKILNVDSELRQQLRLQNIPKTEDEIRQAARSAALDYYIHNPKNDLSKWGEKWHNSEMLKIVRKAQEYEIKALFVDFEGCPVACGIPSNSRWSKVTKIRNRAVCYSFAEYITARGYNDKNVWFLTLTVRHEKVGTWEDCSYTFDRLREGWTRLSANMRAMGLEYLFVIEPHRTVHPHLHGVICGADEDKIKRLISLWCDKYGLGLKRSQRAELINVRVNLGVTVLNYLLKYILKGIDDTDKDGEPLKPEEYVKRLHWAELVYRKRARTFYMTNEARDWIREKYAQHEKEEKILSGLTVGFTSEFMYGKKEVNE